MEELLFVEVSTRLSELQGVLVYAHPPSHDLQKHSEANQAWLPQGPLFSDEHEALLTSLAGQLGMVLENIRLSSALNEQKTSSESTKQLQSLTANSLRQALDASGMGTFTWDLHSDLLHLDECAAKLFHVSPDVPVSRSVLRERLVIPEDRELTRRHLTEALAAKGVYLAEYRIAAPDGGLSWVSARGLATVSNGEVIGMTGIVQDISERKAQEATLIQTEKLAATGRLAATIAHEINNPLEAITNLIYLVKNDPELPPHLDEMVGLADTEVARVGEIAKGIMRFYRDTAHPQEVDLCDLLSTVIQLFAHKLGSKKLLCTVDLEPGLRLFGFAGEMRQVFSNLMVNAIDATSAGTIHLRARSRKLAGHPGVVVLLADQGSGIPPHARKRLFSPFFTTKEAAGTGLGLWVTRGMVEKHGGRIHFRSRCDHPTGTVFRVHLPRAYPSMTANSAASAALIQ